MNYKTIKKNILGIFLITWLSILAHSAGLKSPFVYDDNPTIIHNPHIRELDRFQENVGIENIWNRSFTLLTYAVNLELGGLEVFGYHLFNILFHTLICIVLLYTTQELLVLDGTPRTKSSFPYWVGSIFAAHPITTQTVTYLSSRSSILVAFFSLLGFCLFIRFVQSCNKTTNFMASIFSIILILVVFLFGFASKVTAVAFHFIAIIFLWFRFSGSLKKCIPGLILALVPLITFFTYRTWFFYLRGMEKVGLRITDTGVSISPLQIMAEPTHKEITPLLYFLTQLKVIVFYYGEKMIFPFNLNFEPDISLIESFMDPTWIIPGFILLFTIWKLYYTRSKIIQFGFLWGLIALLPTSSIIPLKQLATEHRVYLAGMGFVIALLYCFQILVQWRKRAFGLILLGVIILFTITSAHRQLDYRSSIDLWYDTLYKSPSKVFLYNNLASDLIKTDRLDEAETVLNRVIEQNNEAFIAAHVNLGNLLFKKGKIAEAQEKFDFVLRLIGNQDKSAFYNSGLTRFKLGKPKEALPFIQKAIQFNPDFAPYHYTLGKIYQTLQRFDEALSEYKLALRYDPTHVGAMNNRGVIFLTLKVLKLAENEFQNILTLTDEHAAALNNLAVICLLQKRYDEALFFLDRYLKLHPQKHVRQVRQTIEMIMNNKTP